MGGAADLMALQEKLNGLYSRYERFVAAAGTAKSPAPPGSDIFPPIRCASCWATLILVPFWGRYCDVDTLLPHMRVSKNGFSCPCRLFELGDAVQLRAMYRARDEHPGAAAVPAGLDDDDESADEGDGEVQFEVLDGDGGEEGEGGGEAKDGDW
jgi:hypothetical protein